MAAGPQLVPTVGHFGLFKAQFTNHLTVSSEELFWGPSPDLNGGQKKPGPESSFKDRKTGAQKAQLPTLACRGRAGISGPVPGPRAKPRSL